MNLVYIVPTYSVCSDDSDVWTDYCLDRELERHPG